MTNFDTLPDNLTLVLGATGKTGRRVAEQLKALGRPVRPGSRSAPIPFDWDDRSTWAAALAGVRSVYVSYQPDLAVPTALATVQAFFAEAVAAGVKQMVLLSGRGEVEAEQAEAALRDTGVDWTILRASWFMQNFSEGHFLDAILSGELAVPVDAVVEPFVDVDDIADIAVAALTNGGHSRRRYELTGPRSISFAEAVGEIGRATGRDIRFASVSPEQYRAALEGAGVPGEVIALVLYLFATVLDGRNVKPCDGVQQALGRAPRSFSDYVARTAASGVWNP